MTVTDKISTSRLLIITLPLSLSASGNVSHDVQTDRGTWIDKEDSIVLGFKSASDVVSLLLLLLLKVSFDGFSMSIY